MYSKEELKLLKKEFWEGFGSFCSMHPAFKKRKSKLMLYNTKLKGVELKLDATRDGAYVILEINHSDSNRKFEIYEKLESCRTLIEKNFPQGLIWDFAYIRECGTEVCRIYTFQPGLDIHRRTDWMAFYRFLTEEMLKLEKAFKTVKELLDD
jgi:hypothetical protein